MLIIANVGHDMHNYGEICFYVMTMNKLLKHGPLIRRTSHVVCLKPPDRWVGRAIRNLVRGFESFSGMPPSTDLFPLIDRPRDDKLHRSVREYKFTRWHWPWPVNANRQLFYPFQQSER